MTAGAAAGAADSPAGPAGGPGRPAGWLAGQVAVITGAGTGIGAAVTRRFAADGAAVVLVGRRPEPLYEAAAELGDRALVAVADAASAAQMADVADTTRRHFGGIDVLVANAGGPGTGTASEITDAAWAASLSVNLTTCLVSARACLPDLVRRAGSIVVVSSIAGLAAAPESVGYVTAKHGLIGLARSMTRDFGPRGVRVNTVCPGWVRTPMADAEMDQLTALRGLPDRDAAYTLATAQVPLRVPGQRPGLGGDRRGDHRGRRRDRGRPAHHRLRPAMIRPARSGRFPGGSGSGARWPPAHRPRRA